MAYADYRLCDICEEKAFYDANLDYRPHTRQDPIEKDERTKCLGKPTNYRLQRLGDWAVLCEDCARTHKCVIVPIEQAAAKQWTDAELLALQPKIAPSMEPREFVHICRAALDAGIPMDGSGERHSAGEQNK